MMKRLLFVLLIASLPGVASALGISDLKPSFGYGSSDDCPSHGGGITAMTTQENMSFSIDEHADGGQTGMNFYLAREIYDHGAKFCPTHVMAWRSALTGDSSHPWLEAWNLNAWDLSTCFVVCDKGWFGDKCSTNNADELKTCAPEPISLVMGENKNKSGSNATWVDGVWHDTWNNNCKEKDDAAHKDGTKHAIALAVKRVTPDGYGVVVQPLYFWAYCKQGKKKDDCRVRVNAQASGFAKENKTENGTENKTENGTENKTENGTENKTENGTENKIEDEVVACLNGYKVSDSGISCEPINVTTCGNAPVCDAWKAFDGADAQYVKYLPDGRNCYEYRCAKSEYGFKGSLLGDPENRKCVECKSTDTVRKAINANGVCEELKNDEIMSIEGQKVKAQETPMTDMIKNKCWQKSYPEDFKNCVLGNKS